LHTLSDIEAKTANISRIADTGPDFFVPLAEKISLRWRELKGINDATIADLLNYLEPYRRHVFKYLYHIVPLLILPFGHRILNNIHKAVKSKEITSEIVDNFSEQIRELELEFRVYFVFSINTVTDCRILILA